jgi:hypothetical protein
MDPLPPPLAFFLLLFSGWVNRKSSPYPVGEATSGNGRCLGSAGGRGRYQRFRKCDGTGFGDRRVHGVQEIGLGIDAGEPCRLAQRVKDRRDLGAAERARPVVILPAYDGPSQRPFRGGMPPARLCRVRLQGRREERENECVSLGRAA